ncbi:glutamine-hydrolyzing carbamoyl-phosphate synthase small subunit [soil metagenome]
MIPGLLDEGPPALLALEDGTLFSGRGFGAATTVTGEACFNTAMTGYQEILSDPSYSGQIVALTAPHIGNTGVNADDDQTTKVWAAGFAVRELSFAPSSWRSEGSLAEHLEHHGVPGIRGLDTRRLTRHLRAGGAQRAALSTDGRAAAEVVDAARSCPSLSGRDLTTDVTTLEAYEWGLNDLERRAGSGFAPGQERGRRSLLGLHPGPRLRLAAYDFGIKRNMLDLLVATGFDVTVLPAGTPASNILGGGYEAVFLSNGPGDPEPVTDGAEAVRALLGRLPIFGICLGHQILGRAVGGRTYKLPFGHRGANHPVRRLGRRRIEITAQNHGYAVDASSLAGTKAQLTHVNLNDGTVEGLELPGLAFSVQYHPEAGPGPHDARGVFSDFRALIGRFEPADYAPEEHERRAAGHSGTASRRSNAGAPVVAGEGRA